MEFFSKKISKDAGKCLADPEDVTKFIASKIAKRTIVSRKNVINEAANWFA